MFKRSRLLTYFPFSYPESFNQWILAIDKVYDKITARVILLYRLASKSDVINTKFLVDALYCLTTSCLRCYIFGISVFKKLISLLTNIQVS